MKRYKLAIVASHPIQYQSPLFKALAKDSRFEVMVYYLWDFGISKKGFDKELNTDIKWDVPLLDGYKYNLLKNYSLKPGPSFFGQINPQIIKELKENNYDAVLVHGYTTATSWLVFLSRWYTGVKIILRGEADLGKKSGVIKKTIKKTILKTLFKNIQAFLYSYQLNKEYFLYYGVQDSKLFSLPCAVDNNYFNEYYEKLKFTKDSLKKSIGIQKSEILTFIFVGKFIKRKRTLDILKAAEMLLNKFEFNILFIGDGEEKALLEQYVLDHNLPNIYFYGFKNQSELPIYYSVSDVLLLPSEFDPSPKQVNEAMNFGIASILSGGVGTAPDLVKQTESGVIHEIGDVKMISQYMEMFIKDPVKLSEMKNNARNAVSKWSYKEDIDGMFEAISSVSNGNESNLNPLANIEFSTSGKHHFFGYYDKSPWSRDGKYLLTEEANFIDRLPTSNDILDIGYIKVNESNKFYKVAETRAWNWQQGCMLEWLGPDFNSKIIYNDYQGGRFVSVIQDILSNYKKNIPYPVYAVHPDGQFALSLSFSRIDRLREGYGYKINSNSSIEKKSLDNDGIFRIEFRDNSSKLIISLADLIKNQNIESMKEGEHWVDHITFNKTGTKFSFLHRWETKNGGMYSRLYVADSDGKNLILLLDTGMVSHFGWSNYGDLLVWGRPPRVSTSLVKKNYIRKLLVPIYHALFKNSGIRQKISGDAFLLFKNNSKDFKKIGIGKLTEDGHATFHPSKNWILSDTYAGKEKLRKLLLYNINTNNLVEVGKFYSLPSKEFGINENWDSSGLRADLHPRFNLTGDKICIDSVHEGTRQVYVINVSQIVAE